MAVLRAIGVALLALAVTMLPAGAQSLQRLTVTQLTLSADTKAPKLEQSFHLTVTAHVRERVTWLNNVVLPILAELELQGDAHSVDTSSSGTSYREVITVVAHHTGPITIAPVTLDAIDARTGKAMRYSSNPLTIVVGGLMAEPRAFALQTNAGPIVAAIGLLLIGGAVAWALIFLARRPRTKNDVPAEVVVPVLVPVAQLVRNDASVLRDALTTLQAERTRAGAMRVRHAVRALVGANDTETLEDVLRRPKAKEPGMREVLQTLERAAFTYESDLQAAIVRAISALEGM